MRPVFQPAHHGIIDVTLPPSMTLDVALAGTARLIALYAPGLYVFEEIWRGRLGGVDADDGDLTEGERNAIVNGDIADRHVRGIRVERLLWKVVGRTAGRPLKVRHNGTVVQFRAPFRVAVARCDRPDQPHIVTLDEFGVRFGRPMPFGIDGAPRHLKRAFCVAYNARLSPGISVTDRRRADRSWRAVWLQLLFRSAPTGRLDWWTRERSEFAALLLKPRALAAFRFGRIGRVDDGSERIWGAADAPNNTAIAVVDDDGADDDDQDDDAVIDGMVNPKLLVPEAMSLGTFLAARTPQQRQRAARALGSPPTTPQGQITHSAVGGRVYPNPFSEFKAAAGGQGVELSTLASYLGSSAHLVAAATALQQQPQLPTALVGDRAALQRYVAHLPPITRAVGTALMGDLHPVAVEFPVYFGMLAADNAFVYSRIDALTKGSGDGVELFEFKTKWGSSRAHERHALHGDLRQAVLYAWALETQTRVTVTALNVRYATVDTDGSISVTTHRHAWRPLRGFVAHALWGALVYVDSRFLTSNVPELSSAIVGMTRVMPAYVVLELVGSKPLMRRPSAAISRHAGEWLLHPTGAMWIAEPPQATDAAEPADDERRRALDAALKDQGVQLARNVTRCLGELKGRLVRLFGRAETNDTHDEAVAVVIRALNRGVNGLVAGVDDVHRSRRSTWTSAMLDAGFQALEEVAEMVRFEIAQVCRPPRQ